MPSKSIRKGSGQPVDIQDNFNPYYLRWMIKTVGFLFSWRFTIVCRKLIGLKANYVGLKSFYRQTPKFFQHYWVTIYKRNQNIPTEPKYLILKPSQISQQICVKEKNPPSHWINNTKTCCYRQSLAKICINFTFNIRLAIFALFYFAISSP